MNTLKAIKSKTENDKEKDINEISAEETDLDNPENHYDDDTDGTAEHNLPYEDDKVDNPKNEDKIEEKTDIQEMTEETDVSDNTEITEIEKLRAENTALRSELENARRLESELADFASVFPEQDIRAIPDEVWQDVRSGNSLSAAFALYERKRINLERRAEQINQLNAYRSPGQAGNNTAREYFSPDEVRAMSQSEVRANYQRIIESMKKWN